MKFSDGTEQIYTGASQRKSCNLRENLFLNPGLILRESSMLNNSSKAKLMRIDSEKNAVPR